MVEFIEDSEHGSPDGMGEFELVAPAEFTGVSLEERWRRVQSFLDLGMAPEAPRPETDLPEAPDVPGSGIDLSDLNQRDLLELMVQASRVQTSTQISMLSTLFDIYSSVRGSRTITLVGSEVIDQQDVPQEVISQESPSDSVLTRKLFLRASKENTAPIAFGDDQIDPQRAFILQKAETLILPIDVGRVDLYMASEEPDQVIQILGVR